MGPVCHSPPACCAPQGSLSPAPPPPFWCACRDPAPAGAVPFAADEPFFDDFLAAVAAVAAAAAALAFLAAFSFFLPTFFVAASGSSCKGEIVDQYKKQENGVHSA